MVVPGPHQKQFIAPRPVGGSYTFGGRQGRMSPTRQRAFDLLVPRFQAELPIPTDWPIIVEVGCGKGDATASMAAADVGSLVIACEPNGAMVANLAVMLDEQGIDNVRLWVGDAFDVFAMLGPASVAEIRIWFPDPWPKPRHAGKRLITAQRLALMIDTLASGGLFRLATDDVRYAEEALCAIDNEPRLVGSTVGRPPGRPITRFEARGLAEGRTVVDIEARRIG